ncbi:TIGR04283 family arsenosugar biosynthesis glycosyltransferase [Mesobacterium pallidum]|uniref:TIGR04283 family arsenosugar biosynthesis glycosyltransferase n=1 Tax=Mesobacterium pallidum TaxID=2872037 RepID=UPI001EE2EC87|nr:TIGR04283 family arsenosugar biosynthesis glycosyltransferase [Mesobacterium pallidum]
MRAPISVIIPTFNAADALPLCLAALGEGLQAGLIRELIVTDGGSTDQTMRLATAAGATVASGPKGRGGQLRRGCAAAGGAWLLVLHADTVLAEGWAEAALRHIERPGAGAACFRLRFDGGGLPARLVAGWANLRSRAFALPYGDQGLLLPRAAYDAAGGYPDQPLMEDVALVRALGVVEMLAAEAVTSARRYRQGGWLRRGTRNLWTLARYAMGVPPERLARDYER